MLTLISLSKFVERFKARKMRTRRQRVKTFRLPLEALESRVLPAATLAGIVGAGANTATFTDLSGDTVTVRVSGTAGTATFIDADLVPGTVANGDEIGGVVITGASSDFTLTYSFDASGDVVDDPLTLLIDETFNSDDTLLMGNITSNRVIRGVFSVPLNVGGAPVGSFTLGSFIGPGFSTHGGLSADDVVGNATDVGIHLTGSLGSTNTINFRGNVDADIRIRGSLNGIIAFGDGVTVDSEWRVDGAVGSTGGIGGAGNFLGTATFAGTFSGSATIDGNVGGNWTFRSSVPASARLKADNWSDVDALRTFGGQLTSGDDINLSVGGSIASTAIIVAGGDVDLAVTGSILAGARVSTGDGLTATVGGNVSGTLVSSDELKLDVTGAITNATLASYSDISLDVGRGISKTTMTGSEITIDVVGGITDSKITASSDLSIDVTGSVTRSQMGAGSDTTTINISGSLVDSYVNSGSEDLELTVGGSIVNSQVLSDESDITVDVGGSVTRSTLGADDDIILNVDGSVSNSLLSSGSGSEVTVAGNITLSTLLSLDTEMTITVGGNVANSSLSGSEITLAITGSLINSKVTIDEGADLEISTGLDVIGCSLTGFDEGISLDVGRDLIRTDVNSTAEVTVTVGRNMTSSQLTSEYDEVSLDVTGNMTNSLVIATSDDIIATVGGNFTNSNLTAYSEIDLDVTGNASGTVTSYSSDVTLDVGGSFTGTVIADSELTAVLGSLNGSLTSDGLDLFVAGNVSASSVIQTISVDDSDDADDIGFRVGGTFAGNLTAIFFDSNEDAGDGVNDLVLGNVLATAKFNIGLFDGAAGELYRFGGSFLGNLSIAQSLDMNLEFNGRVHSVVIGGSVGVTDVRTITVNSGTLNFLSSNSFFDPTGSGDGDFKDGAGNTTGSLVTAGFTTVVPL